MLRDVSRNREAHQSEADKGGKHHWRSLRDNELASR